MVIVSSFIDPTPVQVFPAPPCPKQGANIQRIRNGNPATSYGVEKQCVMAKGLVKKKTRLLLIKKGLIRA